MPDCQLSVVIPSHNDGEYLYEAVESALDQKSSVTELEIIIIDDGSTEPESLKVISHWKSADSRIRVFSNNTSQGAAAARNRGISLAKGEWIAFLDSDDSWTSGSLQSRWNVAEKDPTAQWIAGDYLRIYENGKRDPQGHYQSHTHRTDILQGQTMEPGSTIRLTRPVKECLAAYIPLTSTVLVKRELLSKVGGFEESLSISHDWHLWIRLAKEADLFFVPEVVTLYRRHSSSLTQSQISLAASNFDACRLLIRDPKFRSLRKELRWKGFEILDNKIKYHRSARQRLQAYSLMMRVFLWDPGRLTDFEWIRSVLTSDSDNQQ